MSAPETNREQSKWKKVGPCLYRYNGTTYYALVKLNGKQIRRSLETDDLALARRNLAQLRRDLEQVDPGLAGMTLETHAPRFLATVIGAATSVYGTKLTIGKLLKEWPTGSPRTLVKIRRSDCELWLAQFAKQSASTVNHMITDAKRFFEMAVQDGVIPRNPMDGIKYRKIPKLTRLTPTAAEFEAIVTDLRSQKANGHGSENTADFVELAGRLGLGQAELAGIERQHIDLGKGIIRVFRRKTRQTFTIPIYPGARPIIERRMKEMGREPSARLLPQDNCKKGLAASCKRLGLPNYEPRALRRFFITTALRAGVDAPTVAAWQGHRDGGALVLRTYGDEVRMDHSLKMAERLGA
ncbi:MAG: hypothetical protein SFU53_06735 [Terrimicrobiaceae bacterium]|nr:hypothetical protein [Terrimicrobiaceae bacterium]